jgi:hypothetical protein
MLIDLRSLSLTKPLLDIIDMEPLPFWRDNQARFPAFASLARDILSVPATLILPVISAITGGVR